MIEVPRCPKCGYSYDDCLIHMDHYLCGEPAPKSVEQAEADRQFGQPHYGHWEDDQ